MDRKVALITGGARGIGRGIARTLAGSGYDLLLHYNASGEQAANLRDELLKTGCKVWLAQADLSNMDGVRDLFKTCRQQVEQLSLLVYNSGVTAGSSFLEMDEKTFDTVTAVDWKGCFFCLQQTAKWMIKFGSGHIIVLTSNQQEMIMPRGSAYGGVKAAALRLVQQTAVELAPYGIRVNAIAPGHTDTGEVRMYINRKKEDVYPFIPLKRWCQPEEIGQAVLYLDSPFAASVTGLNLLMDGGSRLDTKFMP
jgi:NAD(P)-dependent dehydrogenase (short-subunit alcohol dehydrogenase family)